MEIAVIEFKKFIFEQFKCHELKFLVWEVIF